MVKKIVATAREFPFKGQRTVTADAITISVDQNYTQNSLVGFLSVEDFQTTNVVSMNMRGKQTVTGGVRQVTKGIVVETPLTMAIGALLQQEALKVARDAGEMTEHQLNGTASQVEKLGEQIDQILNDEPSVMLIGEQAVAVDNGEIFFHQPVASNWLSFLESVDFAAVPAFMSEFITDFRLRSIDVFKGVSGSTGTLEQIITTLDTLGVGAHLTSTPWVKLPDHPAFDVELSVGMHSFLEENAQYAVGLFGQYLRSSYAGLILEGEEISRGMYDFTVKLKRLGADVDFEIDSQDYSSIEVASRAFRHVLDNMDGVTKQTVLSQVSALVDLRYGRINFDSDLPDGMDRTDMSFYKKALGILRRDRYYWPQWLSDAAVLNEDGDQPKLEITLPSAKVVNIRVMDSSFYGFYDDVAIKAIRAPVNKVVHDMIVFLEQLEGIMIYLNSKDVRLSDICPDMNGSVLRVGGVYRELAAALHPAISSPNFVCLLPTGKKAAK